MGRLCKIDGCDKNKYSLEMCAAHYKRFKRHGDPLKGGTFSGEPISYLNNALLQKTDECMIWPFGKDQSGYGLIHIERRKKYVHRVVCERVKGPAPKEKPISRHLCGNGNIGCFNPRHLDWGDQVENMADAELHGTKVKGEKVGTSKLTEKEVLEIYKRGKSGESGAKLSKEFNVSFSNACAIIRGDKWSWLTGHKKKGGD